MSVLQMPSGLLSAQEELPAVITVQREISDGNSLHTIRCLDGAGNEFHPDLKPDYRLRDGSLPAQFDLRTDGRGLPAVRNQTGTGTCWAHATLGSIESNLIQSGKADTDIDLSEAHLVWFALGASCQNPEDPLYGEGTDLQKSAYQYGGSYQYAIESLATWSGYELEANTPPVNDCPSFEESDRYHSYGHVQNMEHYAKDDPAAIKTAIMTNGALYADYYSKDACYSQVKDYYCADTSAEVNHAILIVGWDDTYSSDHFVDTPPGDGAWLCRNSWGDRWGNDGYFYLSYYDATLDDFTSFRAEPADNYDNIYQYDRNWGGWTQKSGSYNCAGANIFTAAQTENLAAVSFYTTEAEADYTIQIYKNITGSGNPARGTLAAETSGTSLYAGYHTIELPKAVSLRKGTSFSVVVSVSKGGIVFDEQSSQESVSFFGNARQSNGKLSYGGWTDSLNARSSDGTTTAVKPNACIKAFTHTGTAINEEFFPDPVIRDYAAGFDTNGDGFLSAREIAANTASSVSFAGTGLKTIQGLEVFGTIRQLDVSDNPIAALDVSGLSLTSLICKDCVVDLGDAACTELRSLGIQMANISSLTGAVIDTRGLVPAAPVISYTYDCGSGFSAVFTLHAENIVHNLAAPSAVDDTLHKTTCADCGYSFEEEHLYGDWLDSKDGTHHRTCSVCGHTVTSAHVFGEWSDENDSVHSHICGLCGAREEAAHQVASWKTDGEATHSGICADCGHPFRTAHSYSSYIDMNAEQHLRKCSDCGELEIADHNWSYVINTLRGNHSRICTDCSRTITESHTFGAWTDNKDGTHTRTCTGCGFAETTDHSFGDYTVHADGTHSRTCTDCGCTETVKYTYGAYVRNTDGTHTHTCTACGHAETAAHSFGACTAGTDGTHTHRCTVCGYEESGAHKFGSYQENADGTHTRLCTDCGYAETDEHTYGTRYTITKTFHSVTCTKCGHVEAAVHTYGKYTDNDDGTHSHVCNDCRYVETQPHRFGDYTVRDGVSVRTCADCGASETLLGDVTLDGVIDVRDVILLQKWLHARTQKGVSCAAADMNGDGILDIFDLALLKRTLLARN